MKNYVQKCQIDVRNSACNVTIVYVHRIERGDFIEELSNHYQLIKQCLNALITYHLIR